MDLQVLPEPDLSRATVLPGVGASPLWERGEKPPVKGPYEDQVQQKHSNRNEARFKLYNPAITKSQNENPPVCEERAVF